VRIVKEKMGLDIELAREFVTFIQEGTPTGVTLAHGHVARRTGGVLSEDGPDGPVRAYPLTVLPSIIRIRVANQRTLDAYLAQRG
jgi:hypothetical protein